MNEFRKPYEYTEEKRGSLLLFVILLISLDILLALFYTVQVYDVFRKIPVLGISFLGFCILYMMFILFTAVTCYQLKKNTVSVSKSYLVVRAVFTTCCIIILFFYNLNEEIGKEYSSVWDMVVKAVIIPLAYVLLFSIGWYLYFNKSKRLKEIINKS